MTRPVTITGDLARMLNPDKPARETLSLTFLGKPNKSGRPTPIPLERNSPVLITGDSHTLVFHDPALHATGAGLPDHIAAGLGIPVDLVGVRGSGATATRISLLRRKDNLEGKKLVIWCFSIREYTESFSGWRKVPVIRR
jgi:alginate O-acetyltransferase complex protein AlgJ